EMRMERRERVVGDLRPRGRHRPRQRRLAGIRSAQEAHVGEHLQRQQEGALLARLAPREAPRGAIHAALERGIAAAALPAARDEELIVGVEQVAEHLPGVEVLDLRADRYRDVEIGAGGARHVAAAAGLTALRLEAAL